MNPIVHTAPADCLGAVDIAAAGAVITKSQGLKSEGQSLAVPDTLRYRDFVSAGGGYSLAVM